MQATQWPADWLRGVLELTVLRVLAPGRSYGYAIATSLSDAGLGDVKGGTLYPLLGRLEAAALIESTWEAGEGGPGRKYFTLTEAGRTYLAERSALWQDFAATAAAFLATPATSATNPSHHHPA